MTAGGVVVAAARFAGERIVGGAVPPWLVVVEGKTPLAVVSLRVVQAVAHRVDGGPTARGVAIASTPMGR